MLPELWTTGYAHDSWGEAAREGNPAALEALGAIARRTNALFAGSTVARSEQGELVNRLSVVGPNGALLTTYDKAHLFAPMHEPRWLRAGTRRVRAPLGPFSAGLSICFDLRFPEMYRLDAIEGADLFLVVAAWPAPRIEAMHTLAAARAIENQAFVVVCNRAGTGADGTAFGGGSCIIGPDGAMIHQAGAQETVATGQLTLAVIRQVRRETPVLGLRVPGVDWRD